MHGVDHGPASRFPTVDVEEPIREYPYAPPLDPLADLELLEACHLTHILVHGTTQELYHAMRRDRTHGVFAKMAQNGSGLIVYRARYNDAGWQACFLLFVARAMS